MKKSLLGAIIMGLSALPAHAADVCSEPAGGKDQIIGQIISSQEIRVFRVSEAYTADPIQLSSAVKYTVKTNSGNLINQMAFCDRGQGVKINRDASGALSGETKTIQGCGDQETLTVSVSFNANFCAFELDIGPARYLVNEIDSGGNLRLDDFLRGVQYVMQPQI